MRRVGATVVVTVVAATSVVTTANARTIDVSGRCSLVAAVDAVSDAAQDRPQTGLAARCPRVSPVANTIVVPSGHFAELGQVPRHSNPEDQPLTNVPYGAMALTITGAGQGRTVIAGGGFVAAGVAVNLRDLTLSHGSAGAVSNAGLLSLSDVTLADDRGAGDGFPLPEGGAIANSGRLTVTGSTFLDDSSDGGVNGALVEEDETNVNGPGAGNSGGAISNELGIVTINDSVFVDDRAGDGGDGVAGGYDYDGPAGYDGAPGGNGGAIYSSGGTVTVTNSTFVGDAAGTGGTGATASSGTPAGVTGGTGEGGAIDAEDGTVLVLGSDTIANSSVGGGLAVSADDSGYNDPASASVTGTLLSDNAGGNCVSYGSQASATDPTLGWTLTGSNLSSGDSSCSGFESGSPALGPLADNGGPVETMALGAGGAAIQSGSTRNCPATDARGALRLGGCDIGAYQVAKPVILGVQVKRQSATSVRLVIDLAVDASNGTLTVAYGPSGATQTHKTVKLSQVGLETVHVTLTGLTPNVSYRGGLSLKTAVGTATVSTNAFTS